MSKTLVSLLSEKSSLCICCSSEVWTRLLPFISQSLNWENQPRWQNQEYPFHLSGQRTLIVQCDGAGWREGWSIKFKGHHLSLLEPPMTAMIFNYGPLSRPTCEPYSSLATAGLRLPSGHAINAGWWSYAITVEDDLSVAYLPPIEDAPCGAMRLRAAEHELSILGLARDAGSGSILPVAYGRYIGNFEGDSVGFNIVAGPFGVDFRANGLFKGMLFPTETECHLYIPSAGLREEDLRYIWAFRLPIVRSLTILQLSARYGLELPPNLGDYFDFYIPITSATVVPILGTFLLYRLKNSTSP